MPKAAGPLLPPISSAKKILLDTTEARAEFRKRRLENPLAEYGTAYPGALVAANVVVAAIDKIVASPVDQILLAQIVGNKQHYAALRSLAAPPISKDDLETLVGAKISKKAIMADLMLAQTLATLLTNCLDPMRFPWAVQGRVATPAEIARAKLATAVLLAVSAVQAGRRSNERKDLEGKVHEILVKAGYNLVAKPARGVSLPKDFPNAGEFMKACTLGTHNADFVIGLKDGRQMAIECKASNSEVNGIKRLNKEVVVDAKDWTSRFGEDVLVPAAALRGVFKSGSVSNAQDQGVYIFWWHRIDALGNFLKAIKV